MKRFRNTKWFNAARLAILGAPVLLVGCHSDFGPFPMPTGYKYHNSHYKAPAGPEPTLKKWTEQKPPEVKPQIVTTAQIAVNPVVPMAQDAGIAEGHWQTAANDLVDRMVKNFGFISEPVFVRAADMASPMEMHFEKSLEAALIHRDFKLAPGPGVGQFMMDYSVGAAAFDDPSRVMLTVRVMSAGEVAHEESGVYSVMIPPMRPNVIPVTAPAPVQPPPVPHEDYSTDMLLGDPIPLNPKKLND